VIREHIMDALLTQLRPADGFVTVARGLEYWTADASRPSLYLAEPKEELESLGGDFPTVTTLIVEAWIYVDLDPQGVPSTPLNPLIDSLGVALAAAPGMRQTLGGRVYSARIGGDGRQHKEETPKSAARNMPVAAAIVPIRIIVP
jgi:hypothetical protein